MDMGMNAGNASNTHDVVSKLKQQQQKRRTNVEPIKEEDEECEEEPGEGDALLRRNNNNNAPQQQHQQQQYPQWEDDETYDDFRVDDFRGRFQPRRRIQDEKVNYCRQSLSSHTQTNGSRSSLICEKTASFHLLCCYPFVPFPSTYSQFVLSY